MGAQERYGVTPDIFTLGKIIGVCFPLAALGASAEIMQYFDMSRVGADKWLMQLGTLSGNPIAAAAGLKTMEVLRCDGVFDTLRANGQAMQADAGNAYQICGDDTLFDVFFTATPCSDYRNAKHDDPQRGVTYNSVLRQNGIFKAPGKFYPSLAVTEADFDQTKAAVQEAVNAISAM